MLSPALLLDLRAVLHHEVPLRILERLAGRFPYRVVIVGLADRRQTRSRHVGADAGDGRERQESEPEAVRGLKGQNQAGEGRLVGSPDQRPGGLLPDPWDRVSKATRQSQPTCLRRNESPQTADGEDDLTDWGPGLYQKV